MCPPRTLLRLLTGAMLAVLSVAALGQKTVPAVLLSDIHFDPFHNPRVFPQLLAAPIERWAAILDAGPDLVEDADRAALDVECHSIRPDTTWPLMKTALAAAHEAEPHPVFVTLSGDLLAHEFPCRFRRLSPTGSAQELSAFAAKTLAFVARQVWLAFPRVPVYVALGNNDSGCADYHQSAGSDFLQSFAGDAALAGAPSGAKAQRALRAGVSPEGDYSVRLPAPLQRGRLIVLNDVFEARQYASCGTAEGRSGEAAQIGWLRAQLNDARARHQQVWVMGHIPPGVDVFSSFYTYILRPGEMCSAKPQAFLDDHALADTLLDYGDVVRLALFGHTHMDEVRVLHRDSAGGNALSGGSIPVKLVPSITPYAGNHPAFLVAYLDPQTLVLKDWQTFVSPGASGSAPPWTAGYRFSTTYHLPDLSGASAEQLAEGFAADRSGREPRSKAYREHFFPGDIGLYALGLGQIWPAYGCAVREDGMERFHDCLCEGSGPKAQ